MDVVVNLTVRMKLTKQESQQAQLQRYFLGCVSEPLHLISAQSNACVYVRAGERTHNLLPPMELHARGHTPDYHQ